jgi:hypothetical protein
MYAYILMPDTKQQLSKDISNNEPIKIDKYKGKRAYIGEEGAMLACKDPLVCWRKGVHCLPPLNWGGFDWKKQKEKRITKQSTKWSIQADMGSIFFLQIKPGTMQYLWAAHTFWVLSLQKLKQTDGLLRE